MGFQWAVLQIKIVLSDTQKNKLYQNYYPKKISEKSLDPKK